MLQHERGKFRLVFRVKRHQAHKWRVVAQRLHALEIPRAAGPDFSSRHALRHYFDFG